MTLRPVDMQTMLPRLPEASRIQQNVEQQPFVMQHAQAVAAQAKAEKARQQVLQKQPSDQVTWQQDGRRQDGQQGQGGKRSKGRPPGKEGPDQGSDPSRGHRLDVKV